MIFIFDWGYRTFTSYGYLTDSEFPVGKDEIVNLYRVRYWFRAFFIPLIPTKTEFAAGDKNSHRYQILSREEFDRLLPFAQLNEKVARGEITEDEYNRQYANLKANS